MKLLLDTHALIWFMRGDERLRAASRIVIEDSDNAVFASAVSAIEITTKFRIGKLPEGERLARDFENLIDGQGITGLPISVAHARLAGSFQHPHRDPFDRLLIAQALIDDLHLVSNETIFDAFGVKRLW